MVSLAPALRFPRVVARVCQWGVIGLIVALVLNILPPLAHTYVPMRGVRNIPGPTVPTTRQLPLGLAPVLNATLAADDSDDYRILSLVEGAATLRAANPIQHFDATFGPDGVQFLPDGGRAWTMRLRDFPSVSPVVADGRVEYRRGDLTEWYVNGPRGLEQGFTLAAAPDGFATFTLALALDGDADVTMAGDAVLIGGMRYDGLFVTDAAGRTLPAHLEATTSAIQIIVDARGAAWPVTVDPFIAQTNLTANDGVANDEFGRTVAVATAGGATTVVVGAPYAGVSGTTRTYRGAAYVFTGSGTSFTQRQKLASNDPADNDNFGSSVAVSMAGGTTTIVVGASGKVFNFTSPPTIGAGAVYVFTGDSTNGYTQQDKLTATDLGNYDGFGSSVELAVNGAISTVIVGAPNKTVGGNSGQGEVYVFGGNANTHTQQFAFADPGSTAHDQFGTSVALAISGGVNIIVAGGPGRNNNRGSIFRFTGSGTTYRVIEITADDGVPNDFYGRSVAIMIVNGVQTIAVGAPRKVINGNLFQGAAYVLSFTDTTNGYYFVKQLTDSAGGPQDHFGQSVAVDRAGTATVVAVGAYNKNSPVANDVNSGVFLYTQSGAYYTQTALPETGGARGDLFGTYVAIAVSPTGDATVVGGAPYASGHVGKASVSYTTITSPPAYIKPVVGNNTETIASAPGTFNGYPFSLLAAVFDANGYSQPSVGMTFTINGPGSGGASGSFDPNTSVTTLHVTTQPPGTELPGFTDTVYIYPNGSAGTFTATATVDGTAISAYYVLNVTARVPTPVINALDDGSAPGLVPAALPVNAGADPVPIVVQGSGFTQQSRVYYGTSVHPNTLLQSAFINDQRLQAYVPASLLTVTGSAAINVYNVPGAAGDDGGVSNTAILTQFQPTSAPAGSSLSCAGSMTVYTTTLGGTVLPPCRLVDGNGNPVPGLVTGTFPGAVAGGSGFISDNGSGVISDHGVGVISNDGNSIVSDNGGGLISDNGLGLHGGLGSASSASVQPSATTPDKARAGNGATSPAPQSGATRQALSTLPARGNFTANTDANNLLVAPPIKSNGVTGTYTRTITVSGVSRPITFVVTNLDPSDGHPATITGLSRTTAATGDPAFTLTVTGTGFVSGSVIAYGGVQLVTTFISATQLSATVPADLLKFPGSLNVEVINPDPNGGLSLPVTFTVTASMSITALSPKAVAPGGPQFTLQVTGTNFVSGSKIVFKGTDLVTTFVSPTSLTATVPANLITQAGVASVIVVNPTGGTSTTGTVTIAAPNALPPVQPTAPPSPAPLPLPGGRPTAAPPVGGPPPNPLPPSR